ncbi:asparagine synthase-related protein [Thermodesulfobacteriota bacterium]
MRIIIDEKYRWQYASANGGEYWYIGDERPVKDLAALFLESPDDTHGKLSRLLYHSIGHFAVIFKIGKNTVTVVDKTRSYPVFYYHKDGNFAVSNSARALQRDYRVKKINEIGRLEFQMAGLISGRETLYRDLYQIQAGEFVRWHQETHRLERERYYTFYSQETREEKKEDLIDELDEVTDKIFHRVIEDANDRPIWIPLSGGLDSRLVICKLKKLGYRNLHAFSYGPPRNYEAKWARLVAERVGVPWVFIPYKLREVRKFFLSDIRKEYWKFSGEYCSLPFMVDEFAIHALKEKGLINSDTVIVNGQSGDFITGGHSYGYHLKVMPNKKSHYNSQTIAKAIIKKHYSLNSALLTVKNIERISNKIHTLLGLDHTSQYSDEQIAQYYEWWEWQERQSKYVVNGQRSYDFFGLRWALPLWADEYLTFWDKIPYSLRFQQYLYKAFLDGLDLFGLFKNFKPVVWNWQGPSMVAIPVGATLKRLFGNKVSKQFYHYAGFFGKYQNHYAPFGLLKWLLNARHLKNSLAFYIDTLFQENKIEV